MTEVTLKVLPEIETRVVELSQKLEAIMVERAPEAWEAALGVVRVDAIQQLSYGAVAFAIFILFSFITLTLFKTVKEANDVEDGFEFLPLIIGGVISFIPLLVFTIKMSNVWVWTAIYSPELVIAKRVLEGII